MVNLSEAERTYLESVFKKYYTQYFSKIQFYAFSYLKNNIEAEGVAQDTFMALWEKLCTGWSQDCVLPLLYIIAKHKCLNILRKGIRGAHYKDTKAKIDKETVAYMALNDDSSTALYSEEIAELYHQALSKMPDKVKTAFLLSRNEDMKYKEIAQKLDISEKTVEYRIGYAFKILRKYLKDYLVLLLSIF